MKLAVQYWFERVGDQVGSQSFEGRWIGIAGSQADLDDCFGRGVVKGFGLVVISV